MENARAAILAHSKPSTWDMTRQQQFLAPRCLKNCRRARKFSRARKAHSRLKRACLELQSKALRLILSAARGNSFLSPTAEERQHFASYMTAAYSEFLRRRGIWHVVEKNKENMAAHPWEIQHFVDELTSYFDSCRTFAEPGDKGVENLTATSRKTHGSPS